MNAISQSIIAKIFSGQYNPENPLTWAALILAGIISGDLSDPDVQLAISRVNRIALSSENPEVWIAALLADIAVNGLSGVPLDGVLNEVLTWGASGPEWGAGTPGPAGTITYWAAPFVSSNGVLLDDPRGVVGDKIHDGNYLYEKKTSAPDVWLSVAVGTVVPS